MSSRTETTPALKSSGGAGRGAGSAVVSCGIALALSTLVVSVLTVPSRAQQTASTITNPFAGRADLVDEGRSTFNQYCAHCHGPNAYQGERSRDLRRLQLRYGHDAPRVFWETVTKGKLDKGMPVWRPVLSDDALWQIFTFLETVQTPP